MQFVCFTSNITILRKDVEKEAFDTSVKVWPGHDLTPPLAAKSGNQVCPLDPLPEDTSAF